MASKKTASEELNSAIFAEDTVKLESLLKSCDVSSKDKNFLLRAAAIAGKLESVKVLLQAGAGVLESGAVVGAAGYGQYECLKLLCEQGADVNETDTYEDSALIVATRHRRVKCVEFLIKNGANVNYVSSKGRSALIVASRSTNFELIQLLLQNGADVNKGSEETGTPLWWLNQCVHKCKRVKNAQGEPADCEHTACLKLLIRQGADVNRVNSDGETPLMSACKKENAAFVKILLDSGADVNAKSNTFDTALMKSCRTPYLGCTKVLLRYGADVNALDNTQFNALSMLKQQKLFTTLLVYRSAVKLLVAAGIKIENVTVFIQKCLDELYDQTKVPLDLKQICRVHIRKDLMEINPKTNLFVLVPKLPLPFSRVNYLLFNVSVKD